MRLGADIWLSPNRRSTHVRSEICRPQVADHRFAKAIAGLSGTTLQAGHESGRGLSPGLAARCAVRVPTMNEVTLTFAADTAKVTQGMDSVGMAWRPGCTLAGDRSDGRGSLQSSLKGVLSAPGCRRA